MRSSRIFDQFDDVFQRLRRCNDALQASSEVWVRLWPEGTRKFCCDFTPHNLEQPGGSMARHEVPAAANFFPGTFSGLEILRRTEFPRYFSNSTTSLSDLHWSVPTEFARTSCRCNQTC